MVSKLLRLATNRNFILYVLIGAMGASIDFIAFLILHTVFAVEPTVASFLSVSLGIVNNFIINSRHNFKTKDNLWVRFGQFYLIGLGGALLSVILIYVLYNMLHVDAAIAKLFTIPPVVLLQYFLNIRFSFKKTVDKGSHTAN